MFFVIRTKKRLSREKELDKSIGKSAGVIEGFKLYESYYSHGPKIRPYILREMDNIIREKGESVQWK
jgi:hypothetical protein